MEVCYSIVDNCNKDQNYETISLSYEERFLRRKKLISDRGLEFLVNLRETMSLSENQAFKLETGKLVLIKSKKEELIEIRGDNLMQLTWHIGNRHLPCQIETSRILIQNDKVIKEMVIKLGGKIKIIFETFNPEGGAYGIGRTHSHKH